MDINVLHIVVSHIVVKCQFCFRKQNSKAKMAYTKKSIRIRWRIVHPTDQAAWTVLSKCCQVDPLFVE